MTCVEPQRMRMTRSFSHYTDGPVVYLTPILKIFSKFVLADLACARPDRKPQRKIIRCPST